MVFFREVHIASDNGDQKPSQQQVSNKRNPFRDTTSNGKIKFIDKIYLIIKKSFRLA